MEIFAHILGVRNVMQVLVLGCGDVGFEVASRLKEKGMGVVIVDKDEDKVEILKPTFHAFAGDFGSPEVLQGAGIENAKAVVITVSDFSEVKRALEAVSQIKAKRGISHRPHVLALIPHDYTEFEARRLGANDVVSSVQVIADAIVDKLERLKSRAFRDELIDEISQKDIEKTELLIRLLKKISREDLEMIHKLLREG